MNEKFSVHIDLKDFRKWSENKAAGKKFLAAFKNGKVFCSHYVKIKSGKCYNVCAAFEKIFEYQVKAIDKSTLTC